MKKCQNPKTECSLTKLKKEFQKMQTNLHFYKVEDEKIPEGFSEKFNELYIQINELDPHNPVELLDIEGQALIKNKHPKSVWAGYSGN